jgi:hypothetical protein
MLGVVDALTLIQSRLVHVEGGLRSRRRGVAISHPDQAVVLEPGPWEA